MKYLIQYNLFESKTDSNYDDIKENIKDILLPISDMGYEIEVNDNVEELITFFKKIDQAPEGELKINSLTIKVVNFSTYYRKNTLKMDYYVKEEFIRMKDYLESEGFKSILVSYVTKAERIINKCLDFNDFIKNDFELLHLHFIAKLNKK